MPITFKGNAMKVGNSMVLVLPKVICDNFGIEKGDTLELIVTDKGFYVPLSPKKNVVKETERRVKEIEKRID